VIVIDDDIHACRVRPTLARDATPNSGATPMEVDDTFSGVDFDMDRLSVAIAIDAPRAEAKHANEVIMCRRDVLVGKNGNCASYVGFGHGPSDGAIAAPTVGRASG
jgi:hypothetical protein